MLLLLRSQNGAFPWVRHPACSNGSSKREGFVFSGSHDGVRDVLCPLSYFRPPRPLVLLPQTPAVLATVMFLAVSVGAAVFSNATMRLTADRGMIATLSSKTRAEQDAYNPSYALSFVYYRYKKSAGRGKREAGHVGGCSRWLVLPECGLSPHFSPPPRLPRTCWCDWQPSLWASAPGAAWTGTDQRHQGEGGRGIWSSHVSCKGVPVIPRPPRAYI